MFRLDSPLSRSPSYRLLENRASRPRLSPSKPRFERLFDQLANIRRNRQRSRKTKALKREQRKRWEHDRRRKSRKTRLPRTDSIRLAVLDQIGKAQSIHNRGLCTKRREYPQPCPPPVFNQRAQRSNDPQHQKTCRANTMAYQILEPCIHQQTHNRNLIESFPHPSHYVLLPSDNSLEGHPIQQSPFRNATRA